jgi:hypothetical protein
MELIEGVSLSKKCDYSFGDQSGQWSNLPDSFMKNVSLFNTEFASKVFEIKRERDYMTVFIDNLRLYDRPILDAKEDDRAYIEFLLSKGTLLELLAQYPFMKFIVFTNLEDTPIDDFIFDKIPDNVLRISAVNAIANGEKVIPAPYGIQRKMGESDKRDEVILRVQNVWPDNPENLLFVTYMQDSHPERTGIMDLFLEKEWAEVHTERKYYHDYMLSIGNSKFVICPKGNAIDCHRNWEVVYMNRVPVIKRHPYHKTLFESIDYPVLFVDDFSEVTEDLLTQNEDLWQKAWSYDIQNLSLSNFFTKTVEEALK